MQIVAPDGAQLLKRRHKVGKGAHSCPNGAFILSHLGSYSDGGTRLLSPWTFLIAPEGARSTAVEALTFFFFLGKGHFPQFYVPKCKFLPMMGHSNYYREGTKWAKGHLYALMGAFILSHLGPIAPYSDGGISLGIISPVNVSHCPWRGTVKGGGIRGPGALALPKFPQPKSASFF